ncbi:MAG: VOC family protein [bacterium]
MPNSICHFEICVKNTQKGIEFYKSLFDWDIKMDTAMPEYGMISTGGEPDGGIFPAQGEMKPYVTIYVKVDDIDGTLDKAAESGAFIIVRKTKISDEYGYYGMFADPDGNVIGLWSKT